MRQSELYEEEETAAPPKRSEELDLMEMIYRFLFPVAPFHFGRMA